MWYSEKSIKENIKKLKNQERENLLTKLDILNWELTNLEKISEEDLTDNKNYYRIQVSSKDLTFIAIFIINKKVFNFISDRLVKSKFNKSFIYNGSEDHIEFYKNILSNFIEDKDFFVLNEE